MDKGPTSRAFNREIFLLVILAATAIGVFAVTRSVAAREQHMEARIADVWYSRGERELNSGEIEKAIESFRKAAANARDNRTYALALANALAAGNHPAEAQQALLRLRESDPENAEINLYLARLAAKQGEGREAIRYYQNALYGRWTGALVDQRRRLLRIELVHFLLDHKDPNRALSELLILATDMPKTVSSQVETAKLFREAGDTTNALKNYTGAIRLDPHNVDALSGAGEVEFQLGNYVAAERHLRTALALQPGSSQVEQLLSLTRMVLEDDPLAPRISPAEQRRRLLLDLQQASQRLETCASGTPDLNTKAELSSLRDQALEAQTKLNSSKALPDSDDVTSDEELVYQIEQAASSHCGTPAGLDQALLLIGLEHGGA